MQNIKSRSCWLMHGIHCFVNTCSPSLSLHYSKVGPLDIVYGKGAYLYNEKDQPYLDCINNVTQGELYQQLSDDPCNIPPMCSPLHTVGHCHPRVVKAFTYQMSTLSCDQFANSDLLETYSSHLLSYFPESFGFIFYFNSG